MFGKTLKQLETVVAELHLPAFSARQIAQWLYRNPVDSFDQMSNLSKSTRRKLAENYEIGIAAPISATISSDGTKKYLYSSGNRAIETAWIPDKSRTTLCVSTQIGCRRGCRFCMTARQGFQGNLSAGEILNQYRSLPERNEVTHFVFMGMGEPLDNLDAVLESLEILSADWGFGFSPRKITVSTIGILESLPRLLEESDCRLALSLHSPFADERAALIPYQRRYPFTDVLHLLRQANLDKRRFTVEYMMIDSFNDDEAHAKELARVLEGVCRRVNLIPCHAIDGFSGRASSHERTSAFQQALTRRGIIATVRKSRGLDIDAACGLLSTKKQRVPFRM